MAVLAHWQRQVLQDIMLLKEAVMQSEESLKLLQAGMNSLSVRVVLLCP